MPRRKILTSTEREALLAFPENQTDQIRYYTFSDNELMVINQHRGQHNRLGFAIQLCYLRYPGIVLPVDAKPPDFLLNAVSQQINIDCSVWAQYAQRAETRREHLLELQTFLKITPFSAEHYRKYVQHLINMALQTDKGIVIAKALIDDLRDKRIIIPTLNVIERVCMEAITCGTRKVYQMLTNALTPEQIKRLEKLLDIRMTTNVSWLAWLRLPSGHPNAKNILEHIERLKLIDSLKLDYDVECQVHQNRLLKLAREGRQMTSQHLRDLESVRQYATLVSMVLEIRATIIDEIVDMHDRIISTIFNRAKRKHAEQFQQAGKAINDKVRLYYQIGQALIEAKKSGENPFRAIESILSWDDFSQSITDAERLTNSVKTDFLSGISNNYIQIRRYAPAFLQTLEFGAASPATEILNAISTLRKMNIEKSSKVSKDAPTNFVSRRWEHLVLTNNGVNRRFYELCALTELKNALRSGDIWIRGSRQFKDFNEYLLPKERFHSLCTKNELPIAVPNDCTKYLSERFKLLEKELQTVEFMALKDQLPDAAITEAGLKITLLINAVPKEADAMIRDAYAMLPCLKITDLLLEVEFIYVNIFHAYSGFLFH